VEGNLETSPNSKGHGSMPLAETPLNPDIERTFDCSLHFKISKYIRNVISIHWKIRYILIVYLLRWDNCRTESIPRNSELSLIVW